MHILYFVLSFALLYFYLHHHFYQKYKKISSYHSCYFCWSVIVWERPTKRVTKISSYQKDWERPIKRAITAKIMQSDKATLKEA
jgi:hypothetical protein